MVDCIVDGCDKPWYARIQVNKKVISLGYYTTEAEAIAARKNAELLYLHNEES